MKVVIGLVGKPLSGKETVGTMLIERIQNTGKIAHRRRFRDILEHTLTKWDIECNRANLQKLAQIMVTEGAFGPNALSHAVYNYFIRDSADVVIADGVRWLSDEKMIRDIPNNKGILLYISSNQETRFARAHARQREGEHNLTREQFLIEDSATTETSIDAIGLRADWTIYNEDGITLEKLKKRVDDFFTMLVLPRL
ncbi:MAG: hypothetical protein WCV80_03415 [Candidatus Paceibacterota bacterium]|jgi:dephospho-CoA kinase